jgi:acetyltransferase-like isoleucine patch superfamily enzyme
MSVLLNFLLPKGIFASQGKFELEDGNGLTFESPIRLMDCTLDNVEIGARSFVSADTQIVNTRLGRYCSIAGESKIGLANHPSVWFSTHPFPYNVTTVDSVGYYTPPFNYDVKAKATIVGHDVWIGTRAMIIGGITIGTGAIIAAGAVVTKDVPPYAIVGGNPAKIIKYRFDEHLREALLNSKWWEIDFPALLRDGIVPPLDNPIAMLEWLKNAPENLPRISSEKRRLIRNGTEWKVVDV